MSEGTAKSWRPGENCRQLKGGAWIVRSEEHPELWRDATDAEVRGIICALGARDAVGGDAWTPYASSTG